VAGCFSLVDRVFLLRASTFLKPRFRVDCHCCVRLFPIKHRTFFVWRRL